MVKTNTCINGIEHKNIMQRFIQQQIKDRTECFDNFPCKNHNCDKQYVDNLLRTYLLYRHMKTDE